MYLQFAKVVVVKAQNKSFISQRPVDGFWKSGLAPLRELRKITSDISLLSRTTVYARALRLDAQFP